MCVRACVHERALRFVSYASPTEQHSWKFKETSLLKIKLITQICLKYTPFTAMCILKASTLHELRAPPWSTGSVLDRRSLSPVFESRCGHI